MSRIPKLTPNRERGVVLTFRWLQVFCSRLGIFAHTAGTGGTNTGVIFFYKKNLDKRLQLDSYLGSIDTLRHMAVDFICMVDIPLWPIYMQWNKSTRVCFIGRCISKTVIQWVPRANPVFFWATSPSPFHFCTTSIIVLLQNTCIIKYNFCPCHHEVIL